MATEIAFYLDEHIPSAIVDGLRRRDMDVRTTIESGNAGTTDRDQLAYSYREGRVLVTHDADFLKLHQEGAPHAGIIFCRQQALSIGDMLRGLVLIHGMLNAEEMIQHIEFL